MSLIPVLVISSAENPSAKILCIPAYCLQALEFSALGLSRWDESGLLKVLLASGLVGEASELYLILLLTPREPGSLRSNSHGQMVRVLFASCSLLLCPCKEPQNDSRLSCL